MWLHPVSIDRYGACDSHGEAAWLQLRPRPFVMEQVFGGGKVAQRQSLRVAMAISPLELASGVRISALGVLDDDVTA